MALNEYVLLSHISVSSRLQPNLFYCRPVQVLFVVISVKIRQGFFLVLPFIFDILFLQYFTLIYMLLL